MQAELDDKIREVLSAHLKVSLDLTDLALVGGGSINDAYRLRTTEGPFFLKTNAADRHPSMFEAEADGLKRLAEVKELWVPKVIAWGEENDTTYLLMEWIEPGNRDLSFWEHFGRGLARLHSNSQDHFGLERDNYIGSLPQKNTPKDTWPEFFVTQRLEPQVKMARDKGRIGGGDALRFEKLFGKMDQLFPEEPPALLHGDLWNGNFLVGPKEGPYIIDPAVYYGHREIDIAMSKLFGGFDRKFYTAYNEERPLEQGWEERVDLCNLYPLMVHVNLFGGGYLGQVQIALGRFV